MSAADPFDLQRFIDAQQGVYESALGELHHGKKRSHWMWFIFPQLAGLGHSLTAQFYAIKNRDEARAYLEHQILGPRLVECAEALLRTEGKSASEILGYPDDLKLCSSMTLFEHVSQSGSVFSRVLERYYGGKPDSKTLELLK